MCSFRFVLVLFSQIAWIAYANDNSTAALRGAVIRNDQQSGSDGHVDDVSNLSSAALEHASAEGDEKDSVTRNAAEDSERNRSVEQKGAVVSSFVELGTGKAPLAWCTSGGGWAAMSMGMGFANAFARAGLFSTSELTNIASNSGGTWFLSQFAYSKNFHERVIGDTAEFQQFVEATLQAYDTSLKANSAMPSDKALVNYIKKLDPHSQLGEYLTVFEAADSSNFIWYDAIAKMMSATPDSTVPYQSLMANQGNRPVLQGPALHFQTSLMTSSYLVSSRQCSWLEQQIQGTSDCSSLRNAYLLSDDHRPLILTNKGSPTIPTQWIVPGVSGLDAEAKFYTPTGTGYDFTPSAIGVVDEDFPSFNAGQVVLSDMRSAPALPTGVSVTKIAAMSSAALGAIGSPQMSKELIESSLGITGTAFTILSQTLPEGMEGLAVCGNPSESGGQCNYPANKFADGAYTDNLATAQTVAYMQKQFGSQRLRFVLTDNWQPGAGNLATDIQQLMGRAGVGPGNVETGNNSPVFGVNVISPQVFKIEFDDVKWEDVTGPAFSQYYNLKWASVSTETVDNPAYGVAAGTKVDLLMFVLRGDLSAMQAGISAKYAAMATNIAQSHASQLLNHWMQQTQ